LHHNLRVVGRWSTAGGGTLVVVGWSLGFYVDVAAGAAVPDVDQKVLVQYFDQVGPQPFVFSCSPDLLRRALQEFPTHGYPMGSSAGSRANDVAWSNPSSLLLLGVGSPDEAPVAFSKGFAVVKLSP
jgi:hypothetical protein